MSNVKELEKLEASRKKKLIAVLLGILLLVDSEDELLSKLDEASKVVIEEVKDIRKASFAIADRHTEETHKVKDSDRNLIVAAAALYLVSTVVRRVSISEKPTYIGKVREAIRNTDPVIDRLIVTEIYEANRKKTAANLVGGCRWNSVNDRVTCAFCRGLDGQIFQKGETIPVSHVKCRCFLEDL